MDSPTKDINFVQNMRVLCIKKFYSLLCFLPFSESGMPKEPLDRTFLAHELNLREDGDSV